MAKKKASSGKVSEETRAKQSKNSETRTRGGKGEYATEKAVPPTAKKTQPVRKSAKSTSSSSVVSKIDLKEVARLVSQLSNVEFAKNLKEPTLLDDLARNGTVEVLQEVAQNRYTSASTLRDLLYSYDEQARYFAAANPRTSSDDIDKFLEAGPLDQYVLKTILKREDLTVERQRKIVNSAPMGKDEYEIAHILQSDKLDPAVIDELITATVGRVGYVDSQTKTFYNRSDNPADKGFIVRELTRNPNISAKTLDRLIHSPHVRVRWNVATHPSTSLESRRVLESDVDPGVSYVAKKARKAKEKNKDVLKMRIPYRKTIGGGWAPEKDE